MATTKLSIDCSSGQIQQLPLSASELASLSQLQSAAQQLGQQASARAAAVATLKAAAATDPNLAAIVTILGL